MKNALQILFIYFLLSFNLFPQSIITYEVSNEIIFNPERGFSAYRSNPITLSFINSLKAINVSVIQRIYTIPQYNDVPLPQSFLDIVQTDLNIAREGGVKLVMRFSYTNNQNGEDAALDTILLHINQLTPVLQANYDVINYVEAGFIGAWGEWYYSSHNLNNTESRRAVTFALLDAVPVKRNIVVRTPDYKRRIFEVYEPLDSTEAFTGSNISRVGAHNDCFVSDETDMGTYLWNDIEGDKDYLNQDNRFVPQGGETCCDCGYADCENSLIDLSRMRWSVLNKDYNMDVLNRWINEGCMDEIKKRLGYRFELQEATISDSIKPTGIFNLDFRIANSGFASPFNPRNLEIVLRNTLSNQRYRLITEIDPRFWTAGDTTYITITAGIPASMEEGNYSAFIFLADPEDRLHDNPDYAIRLANNNLWEDSTGYNSLNHQIKITHNAVGESYNGTSFFELFNGVSAVQPEEKIIPKEFKINVYPNPFNGMTTIQHNFNPQDIIDIRIFDITGRLIKRFEPFEYSSNKIIWNAGNGQYAELSSGVYFFILRTKKNLYSQKLLLLK